ncbi:flavin monoamine oxidase family protein [Alkalihalophilus pseudofirmus]|uniref:Flavin monoamine oxidase family protein n=1 Tax=Alkalihalophilus pseudofirmus TaxID=79885 RepID=A0AAJ2U2P4_ALKPS|nr:flavin monoamine oxidase family protein [Alkalihalophilus pseudofirmus]MDV2886050.1 flavin monoamine oxidase family protein [Alkalihalophilus pseudofirmus]WEG16343.1 flavin monoamine oxidase family protein [Alkalihalophilus pseudofirmus]
MRRIDPLPSYTEKSEEYLKIIEEGLPDIGAPQKDILILGAGMAGLVTGYLLKQAGHKVTIIEGNDRIGGRVHTIREPFSEGNYFEAGAMRIPSHHALTLSWINKWSLSINPFITSTPNDLLYVNGQLVRRYQYEEDPAILKFPLLEDEKGKTAEQLLQEAVSSFVDLYRKANEQQRELLRRNFDQYSMTTFLRNNPIGRTLSTHAIHKIQTLLGIEGFPSLSFLDTLLNIVNTIFMEDVSFYEIEGGNDRLPYSFYPYLEEDIYLNYVVKKIIQHDKGVEVITEGPQSISSFQADYVITTIPFSVFQFIEVEPYHSIKFEKWKAIRTLPYVSSVKVGLEFDKKFWEEDGMLGGKLITDLPTQFMYYPSLGIGKPGPGVLLGSYSWGENARLWESMSDEERVEYALTFISRIHGQKAEQTFLAGTSYNWGQNRFSGGCFSLYGPYQATTYPEIITMPEQRIHFAGEHTSFMHAWIEGAVESGIRAALEVHQLTE